MYKLKDLHVRLTSKCNLNCKHCYAASWFDKNVEIEYSALEKTIAEAIDLGLVRVTFTGGEPLLYSRIYDIINYCHRLNLKTTIETNGILLNKDFVSNLMSPNKVDYRISFDGPQLRGKKNAEIVKRNIEFLKSLNFDIKIQTVLTPFNISKSNYVFDFTNNLDISNRVFLGHSQCGNALGMQNFTVDEVIKYKDSLLSKYDNLIIELPEYISGIPQKGCGWGITRCEIMPNGDVTSCAPLTYMDGNFKAGNMYNEKLANLWDSEHFENIRKIKQEDFSGICSTCKFYVSCKGSCRSVSASIGGSILSSYPYCEQKSKN